MLGAEFRVYSLATIARGAWAGGCGVSVGASGGTELVRRALGDSLLSPVLEGRGLPVISRQALHSSTGSYSGKCRLNFKAVATR